MPYTFPDSVPLRPHLSVAVYKDLQLVLLAENRPGHLVSTAMPAPGAGAPQHPFIHGQATWAPAEHELGNLLQASDSFAAYLDALIAHGYDVLAIHSNPTESKLPRGYRLYDGERLVGVACPLPGQLMTLSQQPAEGELQSEYATVTIYDQSDAGVLYKAFIQATDFEKFGKAMKANGFRLQEI